MAECTEPDCAEEAVVELHIPWSENRVVCAGHARTIARQDGVVADPIDGKEDAWP
jgi:hypothetical protein